MDTVFDKLTEWISAYEIMNHIVPGGVYIILADRLTSFSFLTEHILANIILFYFAGVILGRIGSLIIEGGMEKVQHEKCWFYIHKAPYKDFIQAENKDSARKLHQLLMVKNMYRTLAATAFSLFLTVLYDWGLSLLSAGNLFRRISILLTCLILLFLFLFSFRKQTRYIRLRVESLNENPTKGGKE